MCDKLQASKDGSIDICHSRLAECVSHGIQHYSNNSSSSSTNNKAVSSRKQKKYHKSDGYSGRGQERDLDISDNRQPSKGRRTTGSDGRRWNRPDREKRGRGGGRVDHVAVEVSSGQSSPPGSNRKDGGKKKVPATSLNHLLNFTVASSSRERYDNAVVRPSTRHRRRNTSHSYNKEEFLQANCQFIVAASGNYAIHTSDPDKLVEWQQIEQVRLFCHEIPSCPICLYPPKAAKITRCGHVYCWSCLLHYHCLSDRKWSKCPICNESIYRQDIKSVVALSSPQYKVGDTITMKLMVREKGATQALPKSEWADKKDKMLNIEDSCMNQFVKMLTATPAQVLSHIIEPERSALEAQLAGLQEGEQSEACFIEGALEDLKIREAQLTRSKAVVEEVERMVSEPPVLKVAHPPQRSLSSPASSSVYGMGVPPRGLSKVSWKVYSDQYLESDYQAAFSDYEDGSTDSLPSEGEEEEVAAECLPDPLAVEVTPDPLPSSSNSSSPQSASSEDGSDKDAVAPIYDSQDNLVYFYQASDGQHLYMHPINSKCLAKEYDSLNNSPDVVTATIVELEQSTMTEELRGRFRCLSHLPLTCQLAFCELDLKPPVVSVTTLRHFSEQIHKRKQKRTKKKKDERRREKKAETTKHFSESGFQGSSSSELTPEKFHDFLSLASSPSLIESVTLSIGNHSGKGVQPADSASRNGSPEISTSGTPPTPSFAQALQNKTAPVWPVKQTPSKSQPVSKLQQTPVRPSEDEVSEENSVVPSFRDAFNEAFESAALKSPEGRPGSKMAKKGRKKLVLFSTGGSRGAC